MYYVLLADKAIGPFIGCFARIEAYNYGADKLGLRLGQYTVKSKQALEHAYFYLPVVRP
jgi:hypothetical protein